jgi:hypothetical protein
MMVKIASGKYPVLVALGKLWRPGNWLTFQSTLILQVINDSLSYSSSNEIRLHEVALSYSLVIPLLQYPF